MPQAFNIEGAPLELLDVGELALIHSNYRPMDTWLLDQLFPNELLRQVSGNTLTSSGPSSKPVDVNSLAPQMNKPIVSNTTTPASKSVAYNINIGGQTVTLYGDESDQDPLDKMMRQLETLKKGM